MSGPAGGVTGALWVAVQAGFPNLLTIDVGGTSTDVALIQNGEPRLRRETTVGDVTVRASSVDIRTVGAGGGSIAHVPELTKALRVGPQSAGADPGPAAYGKGGTEPTVTDANVVLGYLPEMQRLGGDMALDRKLAHEGRAEDRAMRSAFASKHAALGIYDIVNENMVGALRLVSVEQGYDPRDYALIAFGGAGPLHANALARLLGSWPVDHSAGPGRAVRARRCDDGACATSFAHVHAHVSRRPTPESRADAAGARGRRVACPRAGERRLRGYADAATRSTCAITDRACA